ncbi:MAG TPA: sigma-70 family RNA polymerase sigma factor, partial [Gemmatimonadales bacterium]|nr:sigma-70 family RNA polymerase sigma factor [Gemmatimonadales bacterium]
QFEEHRPRLRAVADRMLGSLSEAEDAVQESWLRVSRADAGGIQNMGGWLTTVVSRVCLNLLRARAGRREQSLETHLPDPIVTPEGQSSPEQELLLADSVGLALLVVLETLDPAERLAFVLHDTFGVPFDEIAPIVGRSPAAARQLASRARRRVRGAATDELELDRRRQRELVDAFLAAARGGDFDALLQVLDPDVVLRSDGGGVGPTHIVRGARNVAGGAVAYSARAEAGTVRPVLVNGAAGVAVFDQHGEPVSLLGFTVARGRIVEINILTDPGRLRPLLGSIREW